MILPDELDERRIAVIHDPAVTQILCGDLTHLFLRQLEIPDVDVLFHPLHVNRFRDDGNVALHVPSQNHLRRCFTVFFTDSNQLRICNDIFLLLAVFYCIL